MVRELAEQRLPSQPELVTDFSAAAADLAMNRAELQFEHTKGETYRQLWRLFRRGSAAPLPACTTEGGEQFTIDEKSVQGYIEIMSVSKNPGGIASANTFLHKLDNDLAWAMYFVSAELAVSGRISSLYL